MALVRTRRRGATLAAVLVGGSGDVVDFLLPLWAGVALGASAAQIGVLVAIELVASFVARPLAGWLVDTRERTGVAAAGAALTALGCFGYAVADGLPLAQVSAATTGVGGALLWVAVRAIVAEALPGADGAFAHLMSAVAFGSWFFWVPAMVLLPAVGYPGVFAGLGGTCVVACLALVLAPRRRGDRALRTPGAARGFLHLSPLLVVVGLLAAAEGGIGLLLLLHLQRAFDLEVFQIALVFLPGGIALTVLPPLLHRLTVRYGRTAVHVGAPLASAAFAASLASSPGPVAVAVLWVLTSAAWAALTPIHQTVVAELSAPRTGRGMSLLGNAGLAGAALGALLAGALYDGAPWLWVCVTFATIIAVGAPAGAWALSRSGVATWPRIAPDDVPVP